MRYALLGLVLLAGCPPKGPSLGLELAAPDGTGGKVHVEFESDLQGLVQGSEICDLRFGPSGNLLKDRIISAGAEAEMYVRPGRYHVVATSCTGEKHEQDADVQGWTIIQFDYQEKQVPPADEAAHVHLFFTEPDFVAHPAPLPPQEACIPDGQYRDVAGEMCCTNTKHYSGQLGRWVCGP